MASVFSNVTSSVVLQGERCRWRSEGALPLATPPKPFQDGTRTQRIEDARLEQSKRASDLTDVHYGQDASSTAVVSPHGLLLEAAAFICSTRDVFLWRCKLGHRDSDDALRPIRRLSNSAFDGMLAATRM